MAQHTFTISDEDGGISIRVESNDLLENSAAGLLAKVLVSGARRAAAQVSKANSGPCSCPRCQAEGTAASTVTPNASKPTLH